MGGRSFHADQAILVRALEYEIPDLDGNGKNEIILLITSISQQDDASAVELAADYHERWEVENLIDEVRTHQRGAARVLRSQSPSMVLQEVWALLLTRYGMRALMCRAADEADVDRDRLSFMRAQRRYGNNPRVVKRQKHRRCPTRKPSPFTA